MQKALLKISDTFQVASFGFPSPSKSREKSGIAVLTTNKCLARQCWMVSQSILSTTLVSPPSPSLMIWSIGAQLCFSMPRLAPAAGRQRFAKRGGRLGQTTETSRQEAKRDTCLCLRCVSSEEGQPQNHDFLGDPKKDKPVFCDRLESPCPRLCKREKKLAVLLRRAQGHDGGGFANLLPPGHWY